MTYSFVTFSCQNVLEAVLQSASVLRAVGRNNSQGAAISLTLTLVLFAVNSGAEKRIRMLYFRFLLNRILVEWKLPPLPSPVTTPNNRPAPAQFPVETWLLQPRQREGLGTAVKFCPELQPPVLCLLWNKPGFRRVTGGTVAWVHSCGRRQGPLSHPPQWKKIVSPGSINMLLSLHG